MRTGTGKLELQIPRDRLASFKPQLAAKYQRRFPGFDDKIVSMYARGMSTWEIHGHLRELYALHDKLLIVVSFCHYSLTEIMERCRQLVP